ncbi:flavodoxin [Vibrio sp. S9_S30]|uniref:flavodoxin n=1 Tax=Vibrio sp. S9_S30 TaxID=2720226 RepID=UPI0016801D4C|nr:flavodoxin [Vibrio sp. S9_S30]MBD1557539.1 flavodoxin [Vibrio sp. S9_S30]
MIVVAGGGLYAACMWFSIQQHLQLVHLRILGKRHKHLSNQNKEHQELEVHQELVERKNQWLCSQVDVKYPTKESLAGRKLYKAFQSNKAYTTESVNRSFIDDIADEIFIVDFHRLTICFATLYSNHWEEKESQSLIIEFLTQIILEPDFPIIIGFKNGEPIGCALGTILDKKILISDIYLLSNEKHNYLNFVQQVVNFMGDNFDVDKYIVEHHEFMLSTS